ncbi:MAG: valine--tRNA ligase [bacterium]|nr:valine--tRNA ligase [bacterium]
MTEEKKEYLPEEIEARWYKFWLEKNYFKARVDKKKTPFTIVIPPPNVTGVLHMGHGLNNTIQDILIRYERMRGKEACWVPGTDHAGIATQTVVEKNLLKETGKNRDEIGREEFLKKVWAWREENGQTIIEQLKKIGASCDWDRTRFTMDNGLSLAVREVFVRLYEKGLIYRGNYIVNWCPRCTTALADDEVEYREHRDKLYYFKYPVKDSDEFAVVATTRPETMLGDTGVAVHPDDKRYKKLKNKKIILPLVNREIPLITDKIVDMEFGTGAVKVTPSHDPNDFDMGKRHNLEFISIMDEKGVLNKNVPALYQGMDRYKARQKVVEDMESAGLVAKIDDYRHSVGHCYRCDSVIEPYQSTQWFVKMKPLAAPAIKAVEKKHITFYPPRWEKVYLNWMNNIRDWCISRQIWWGHRIPVWYCEDCRREIVSRTTPEKCHGCKSTRLRQDEDVLDTWFSSWLWPFSTLGWPEKGEVLDYFYPTNVLVTDPGIIFFWVARMIMAGLEFMKEIPFRKVHLHGVVLDNQGRKMSKSLGNGIDPLEVVKVYGADALRYTMVVITPAGQNLLLSMDKFAIGKHFANKIFNASRYVLMNHKGEKIISSLDGLELDFSDRWILSKLNRLITAVHENIENYKFQDYALGFNEFFWHEFCDWYLEISKIGLYQSNDAVKSKTLSVLFHILLHAMKIFHPIMPFITEEIYQTLPNKDAESIMVSPFPGSNKTLIDHKIEEEMETGKRIVTSIRNLRVMLNIKPTQLVKIKFSTEDREKAKLVNKLEQYIKFLCHAEEIQAAGRSVQIKRSAVNVTDNIEIFIDLEGLVDIEKEKARLLQAAEKIRREIAETEKKLKNEDFVKKAKEEAVAKVRQQREKSLENLRLLERNISIM